VRVAFVNQPWNACPPVARGSIAIWTCEVARRLARAGDDVVVYAGPHPAQARASREDGVAYRRFGTRVDRAVSRWVARLRSLARRGGAGGGPMFASAIYHLTYAARVALDARRRGVEVVHLHNFAQFAPVVRRIHPGAAVVLHMHCEWLSQLAPGPTARRLARCDAVVGCSAFIAREAAASHPAIAGRTAAVANGVDLERFRPREGSSPGRGPGPGPCPGPTEEPRILFVGRLSPEKGLHRLIEAFREVAAHDPRAVLEIVGSEQVAPREFLVDLARSPEVRALGAFYEGGGGRGYRARLEALVPPSLRSRVVFAGGLPHERLAERYAAAAVLVNPSLSEAFGMSLAEAMASGLPVVATTAGGMPEVVEDGRTGLLVPPDDAPALAAAIRRLLGDGSLRASLGRAGRARAEALFGWETVAAGLRAVHAEARARALGRAGRRGIPGGPGEGAGARSGPAQVVAGQAVAR